MNAKPMRASFEEACAFSKNVASAVNFGFFGVDATMQFLREGLAAMGWTLKEMTAESRLRMFDRVGLVLN